MPMGVEMRRESLTSDEIAADKMVMAAALTLLLISAVSIIALLAADDDNLPSSNDWEWVDPITEVEDENHFFLNAKCTKLKEKNSTKK